MLSISDVLLAGRGVITGPGVISAAVLVCQGVSCCLSDHHSGVIFAVVVVCKQKHQQELQQQEWRPWGTHCVEAIMLLISVWLKSYPDRPRDVILGHVGVIVLET